MKVFISGASGFIGLNVRQELDNRKIQYRVLSKKPITDDYVLKDVLDVNSADLKGCDVIIHLIGLISEKGEQTYKRVVIKGTKHLCKLAGSRRIVYVSAIGANQYGTPYQKAKFESEKEVMKLKNWNVIRPSMVIGAGNHLEQVFTPLLKMHFLPVFGHGNIQPIDVKELSKIIVDASIRQKNGLQEVGGRRVISWLEYTHELAKRLNTWAFTPVVPKIIGNIISRMPFAPFTNEQWQMLQEDNVVK